MTEKNILKVNKMSQFTWKDFHSTRRVPGLTRRSPSWKIAARLFDLFSFLHEPICRLGRWTCKIQIFHPFSFFLFLLFHNDYSSLCCFSFLCLNKHGYLTLYFMQTSFSGTDTFSLIFGFLWEDIAFEELTVYTW